MSNPSPSEGAARRAVLHPVVLLSLACWAVLLLSCAVPGRLYEVTPQISGIVRERDQLAGDVRIARVVQHRESANLFDRSVQPLAADGRFEFDALRLAVAGREYSKVYRVFLHLEMDKRDRVVWRTAISRRDLAGPIELDCRVDRPVSEGQPCRVRNPLEQPWLIAEGERQFQRLCADCHGRDARGTSSPGISGPANVPLGERVPPDLTRIAERWGGRFDRTEIAAWIEGSQLPAAHRARSMPIWGERLSAEYARYAEGDALIGATLDPILVYLESRQTISR